MTNILLKADSYKHSHYWMYPENTQYISSYIEARGGGDYVKFVGLQGFISEYLLTPFVLEDINEAERTLKDHMGSFNRDGWLYILHTYDGYLPLEIKALPEGTMVPIGVPMVQVRNTDPECAWLTSFIETALLRAVWYPSTVATISAQCARLFFDQLTIKEGMSDEDANEAIKFMLHDFGARGVSSSESSAIGGFGHLTNFSGTDTLESIEFARMHYGTEVMPAFSVDATEHSTVTSWGEDGECDMYKSMIAHATKKGSIISIVSDSYDIWNAIEMYGKDLYTDIIDLSVKGGRLVVRPDSGDPVTTPIEVCQRLGEYFGLHANNYDGYVDGSFHVWPDEGNGYKSLPSFIRVLQGDGIGIEEIKQIIEKCNEYKISLTNFIFGMGGGLLQKVNRDTFKFAMKASARFDGEKWHDVYKNAPGKVSKRGIQVVNEVDGKLTSEYSKSGTNKLPDLLELVYKNGEIFKEYTLDDLRTDLVRSG